MSQNRRRSTTRRSSGFGSNNSVGGGLPLRSRCTGDLEGVAGALQREGIRVKIPREDYRGKVAYLIGVTEQKGTFQFKPEHGGSDPINGTTNADLDLSVLLEATVVADDVEAFHSAYRGAVQ